MAKIATQPDVFADGMEVQDPTWHEPRSAPVYRRDPMENPPALNQGVYFLRPGTPDSVVRRVIRDPAFDTLFLDASDWESDASLVSRTKIARNLVEEAGVKRFQPVIVSVRFVPRADLGRVVKLLAYNDIPVTSTAFALYAVPPAL